MVLDSICNTIMDNIRLWKIYEQKMERAKNKIVISFEDGNMAQHLVKALAKMLNKSIKQEEKASKPLITKYSFNVKKIKNYTHFEIHGILTETTQRTKVEIQADQFKEIEESLDDIIKKLKKI